MLQAHIALPPTLCGQHNYASCGLTDYFTDRDTHTFLSLALIHTNVHTGVLKFFQGGDNSLVPNFSLAPHIRVHKLLSVIYKKKNKKRAIHTENTQLLSLKSLK